MIKFILKICQFSIVPALIVLLLGVRQEQDRVVTLKRQLFEQHKASVECLITGTSHTLNGINPMLLPVKALNIAEDGKSVEIDIEIIEKNLNQLPRLKYVIIPVDYFTFYFTGKREKSAAKLYHHWNLKDGFVKTFSIKRYHALTCGFLLEDYSTNDEHNSFMGYEPEFKDLSKASPDYRRHKYKRKIIDWNRYWIDTNSAPQIFKRLKNFISMLEEKHIKTILVTMPVCKAFYTCLDPKLLNTNNQFIDSIINTTNAKYINLQNNPLLAADSLFFDIDHLNDKGATIATGIIKNSF